MCSGCRRELGRGFDGLAGEVGRERGEGEGACSGIVWLTTPPPPPRPSSQRGIELLEPCRDLKVCSCFYFCFISIVGAHLQPRIPRLDPCDRELSGLLGVPLPTLMESIIFFCENVKWNSNDRWRMSRNLDREGESGGAGGGGGLASSAASRNTSCVSRLETRAFVST